MNKRYFILGASKNATNFLPENTSIQKKNASTAKQEHVDRINYDLIMNEALGAMV